jgi:hypothetical protein
MKRLCSTFVPHVKRPEQRRIITARDMAAARMVAFRTMFD